MPRIVIVAGPHGAGKSTLSSFLAASVFDIDQIINVDLLAAEEGGGESGTNDEHLAIRAGKKMTAQISALVDAGQEFILESRLSNGGLEGWFRDRLLPMGYEIEIVYLSLSSPDLAMERSLKSGKEMEEESLRRKYKRSLAHFFAALCPMSKRWSLFCQSDEGSSELIAEGEYNAAKVFNQAKWGALIEQSGATYSGETTFGGVSSAAAQRTQTAIEKALR